MAHIHNVRDTDIHYKIDGITRTIVNVDETKRMLVQSDHNSERLTFEIPRYVDGHDLTTCNVVQVHYMNVDTYRKNISTGVYEVDDLGIKGHSGNDANTVVLSWLVSASATKHVGSLDFVIRFSCVTNDVIDYAWNTTVFKGITILEGIYNSNNIIEQNLDILSKWREELFYDSNEGVTKIEQTKNEAIEAIFSASNSAAQPSFIITVTMPEFILDGDMSSIKADKSYSQIQAAITAGRIPVVKLVRKNRVETKILHLAHTIPANPVRIGSIVFEENINVPNQYNNADYAVCSFSSSGGITVSAAEFRTVPDDGTEGQVLIKTGESTYEWRDPNAITGIAPAIIPTAMGEAVTISDSAYRPLAGLKLYGKTTQVTTTGKNLLPPYSAEVTSNGVTFKGNADGSITIQGTATADIDRALLGKWNSDEALFTLAANTPYVLSGYTNEVNLRLISGTTTLFSKASPKNTFSEQKRITSVFIYIASGTTVKTAIYPQLEVGSTATSYEPYTGGKPAPSPEYPQELVNVGAGGSIGVKAMGKNILPGGGDEQTGSFLLYPTDKAFEGLEGQQINVSFDLYSPDGSAVSIYAYQQSGLSISNGYDFIPGAGAYARYSFSTTVFRYGQTLNPGNIIFYSPSGAAVKVKNVQVEFGTTAMEYKPYKDGGSLNASTPNGLPGIKVANGGNYTDNTGQQWICDEIDFVRGVYVQRIQKLVFDGVTDGHKFNSSDSAAGTSAYISKR